VRETFDLARRSRCKRCAEPSDIGGRPVEIEFHEFLHLLLVLVGTRPRMLQV
jgi:hypothetical protein